MKEIFNQMMHRQNTTLKELESTLNSHFNRVIINDLTSFILPKESKKEFLGSGGETSPSTIKIQLQYDLFPGTKIMLSI